MRFDGIVSAVGSVGECLMVRRKREDELEWHHRVPDFKLVYCGPKKEVAKKEAHRKRSVLVSVIEDGNENIDRPNEATKEA